MWHHLVAIPGNTRKGTSMSRHSIVRYLLPLVLVALLFVGGCGGGEKQNVALLSGTTWHVIKYKGETGNLVVPVVAASTLAPVDLTLRFLDDQKVTGNGGVNTFGGSFSAKENGAMRVGPLSATTIEGPPELTGQEEAYVRALEAAVAFRVSKTELELLDEEGNALVRLRPAKSPPLEGVSWNCTGFNDGKRFAKVLPSTQITATFEKGKITGNSGLNRYTSRYRLDGDSIEITDAAATTGMESAVPANMDQEQAFIRMLGLARRYEVTGNQLTLYGDGSVRLASFEVAE